MTTHRKTPFPKEHCAVDRMPLPPELLEKIAITPAENGLPNLLFMAMIGMSLPTLAVVDSYGPGRVMDDFLDRGAGSHPTILSALVPLIPSECAILKGVARKDRDLVKRITEVWRVPLFSNQGYILSMIEGWKWGVENVGHDSKASSEHLLHRYYILTQQWDKFELSSWYYQDLATMSMLPEKYIPMLGVSARLALNIYRGLPWKEEKLSLQEIWRAFGLLLYSGLTEKAIQVARWGGLNEADIRGDLFQARSLDGLKRLGTLSEKELLAYESCMDPDEVMFYELDEETQQICDDLKLGFYPLPPWWSVYGLSSAYYEEGSLLKKVAHMLTVDRIRGKIRPRGQSSWSNYTLGLMLAPLHDGIEQLSYPHPTGFHPSLQSDETEYYEKWTMEDTDIILLVWYWFGRSEAPVRT